MSMPAAASRALTVRYQLTVNQTIKQPLNREKPDEGF